jgi:hypothetical protein
MSIIASSAYTYDFMIVIYASDAPSLLHSIELSSYRPSVAPPRHQAVRRKSRATST